MVAALCSVTELRSVQWGSSFKAKSRCTCLISELSCDYKRVSSAVEFWLLSNLQGDSVMWCIKSCDHCTSRLLRSSYATCMPKSQTAFVGNPKVGMGLKQINWYQRKELNPDIVEINIHMDDCLYPYWQLPIFNKRSRQRFHVALHVRALLRFLIPSFIPQRPKCITYTIRTTRPLICKIWPATKAWPTPLKGGFPVKFPRYEKSVSVLKNRLSDIYKKFPPRKSS